MHLTQPPQPTALPELEQLRRQVSDLQHELNQTRARLRRAYKSRAEIHARLRQITAFRP